MPDPQDRKLEGEKRVAARRDGIFTENKEGMNKGAKEKEKNEIWYAYERLPVFAQKKVLYAYKRLLKTNTQAFYDRDITRNIYDVPAIRLNFFAEWLGLAIEFKPPHCHVFIQGATEFGEFTEDWYLLEKDAEGNFTEVPVPDTSIYLNPRTTIKEILFN